MSGNKPRQTRKASTPVSDASKPKLRLLRPPAECATTNLITELSQEVKSILQGMKRKRAPARDDDEPEAA
jgi:hypothetical protein